MSVVVLGEVLVDLFCPRPGVSAERAAHLVPHPGGAPANCAAQLARLGVATTLVTAIGDDPLGRRVLAELAAAGVQTGAVRVRRRRRTGVTLVEVDADGERRFTPWREGSADLSLDKRELPLAALDEARLLVHGTVSLRKLPARAATTAAVTRVRRAGGLVALDVNLRPQMYPDRASLLARATAAVRRAHVVKATVDEARAIVGGGRPPALLKGVLALGPSLVALTDGGKDAWLASRHARARASPEAVRVTDATGAGDAFFGALLADLARGDAGKAALAAIDERALGALLARANKAGAAATSRLGATTAMLRRLPGRAPLSG